MTLVFAGSGSDAYHFCNDGRLREYFGNLIMVGINYDKYTRKHTCLIERSQAEGTEQTMEKHLDANDNSANNDIKNVAFPN